MGQLEDMHVFARVVEAGSISRAAEQLGQAKSAVSRRLVALETRLGTKLLNRTTRSSNLTEAGKSYYERALKILDDVDELNAETTDTRCQLAGAIRLAAPLSFGLEHLTPALNSFLKEHPKVSVDVDFSDRKIDLIEEGIDLAFRITRLQDSSLQARRLSPIRFSLCASPDYLNEFGTPTHPDELTEHKHIVYRPSPISEWVLTDKNEQEYKVALRSRITANNGSYLKDMAIAGQGIYFCPNFIAWKDFATGNLIRVLPNYRLIEMHAYALYPQTRYLSQRVRILIDFLAERFGDNPYWEQGLI